MKKKKEEIKPPEPPFTIREYESSPYWHNKSQEILKRKDVECQICHRKRWKWMPHKKKWKRMLRMAVHHITYDNVPNEKDEDLMTLCYTCHTTCHLILQLENLAPMYKELTRIVLKYFKYEDRKHKKVITKKGE